MNFSFNVNYVLPKRICKITKDLLPEGYMPKDRQSLMDCTTKVSDILDKVGRASAKSQGLQKPLTSGDRIRQFEHIVYILVNEKENEGNGQVYGLLQIGKKKLFLFDATGQYHEVEPLCVLDFYIHESKQRKGCGKELYEYMLEDQNVPVAHLAIDGPPEKLLQFLYKHYGLRKILPQRNNFVVFDKFFEDIPTRDEGTQSEPTPLSINPDISAPLGAINNNVMPEQSTCYGRYAAHNPESTIADIIKNSATTSYESNSISMPCDIHKDIIEQHSPVCDENKRDLHDHTQLW